MWHFCVCPFLTIETVTSCYSIQLPFGILFGVSISVLLFTRNSKKSTLFCLSAPSAFQSLPKNHCADHFRAHLSSTPITLWVFIHDTHKWYDTNVNNNPLRCVQCTYRNLDLDLYLFTYALFFVSSRFVFILEWYTHSTILYYLRKKVFEE